MDQDAGRGRGRLFAIGAMAEHVRAFDWTATPLGGLETWPERLIAAVELVLSTPQLAALAIGPQRIFVYNDAAARHYGGRHPHVLGLPLGVAFATEFGLVEGFYDRVFAGESVHVPAQPLDPAETGTAEIFDAYLAPVHAADGTVIAAHMTGIAIGARLRAEAGVRRSEADRRTGLERRIDDVTAALAASHDLLKGTIDASRDMIQVFEAVRDDAGAIVDFRWILNNRTSEQRYGEVRGESLLARNPGVVAEGIFDAFCRVAETGTPEEAERQYRHEQFDGWFLQSVVRLGDGVATTTRSIDDWKAAQADILRLQAEAAEARVNAAETRYQTLFDTIDQGFCVIERIDDAAGAPVDYVFAEANAAFREQAGMADPVGRRVRDLVPDQARRWHDMFDRIALTGRPERFEHRAARLDHWYDIRAFRTGGPGGHGVAILFSDISARKRDEAALLESRRRFRMLATAGDTSVYRMSADWRVMFSLDSETLAITADPIVDWIDKYILPEDRAGVLVAIDQAIATKSLFDLEHRVRQADGSVGWVHSRAVPLLGSDGAIVEWFGTGADVNERRAVAEALRESEARQKFLLDMTDRTRAERDADAIIAVATRMLGERLGASRIVVAEIDDAAGMARIRPGWTAPGAQPHPAELRLDASGGPLLAALRDGRAIRYDDVGGPPFARPDLAALHAIGAQAGMSVPMMAGGRLVMSLDVHQHRPRRWTEEEVALVGEVAERLWATIERARAEAALARSEQRLALALRTLPVGIAIVDARGATTMANDEMRRFLPTGGIASRDPGRVARWQALDADGAAVPPVDFPGERALRGETVVPGIEMIYRDDSGARIWTEVLSAPIRDGDGTVGGALVVVIDVDRIKRSERAALASEERLRRFGDASRDILWLRDAATLQWVYLTPAFETIYGLDRREALTGDNYRGWQDMIVPEDRAHAAAAIARVRAGEHVTFEYRIRRPGDGAIRWLRDTDFPVFDDAGRIVLIGGIGHDFTKSRAAELRYRTLIEGIPQLVWQAVDVGDWIWASPQWTGFTGQDPARYRGWGWLDALHPDDRAAAREAWAQAAGQGGFEVEYRIRDHRQGRYRWFQTRAVAVRDHGGAIIEWLGTSTDIDELRRLQESQGTLLVELQHRVRNILAVTRSIISRSDDGERSTEDYVQHLQGRISALARTQVMLTRRVGAQVDLEALVRDELMAQVASADQFLLAGPDVALSPKAAEVLTLALHELATNATKYGAFSRKAGRLEVGWAVDERDGRPWLVLDWREHGIPIIDEAPRRRGFGAELISRRIPYELRGHGHFELRPGGLHSRIEFPLTDGQSILQSNGASP